MVGTRWFDPDLILNNMTGGGRKGPPSAAYTDLSHFLSAAYNVMIS